ncbi:hypothetical protein AB0G71_22755 [Streptomyces sp. NPDC020403]|uniref:hypothetical protein n=1 Tax=unclassified Streptomyces TaxID=2593676 RepID=UPI0034097A98
MSNIRGQGPSLATALEGLAKQLLPAPAGMVPTWRQRRPTRKAAPRTRGGGPTKPADEILDKVASYCQRISDSGH